MKNTTIGYILIFLAGTLWGTIGFFVNSLTACGVRSDVIPLFRIGFALVLLLIFSLIRKGPAVLKIDGKGLFWCAIMGVCCQALFNLSYTLSIQMVGVSTGAVLLYTAPVFVCIMARLFFREPIWKNKVIALVLNLTGCVLTVTNGDLSTLQFSPAGIGMGVLAGFLYGLLTIIGKSATADYDPLTIGLYGFFFGTIALLFIGRPWEGIGDITSLDQVGMLGVFYGLTTMGAYVLYLTGISRKVEASRAPVIASVETVVAALIGIGLFHEITGIWKIIGILLVLISIIVMNREPKEESAK